MNKLYKNILWVALALVVISFAFSFLSQSTGSTAQSSITLNELVDKIDHNEVSEIKVSGDNLTVTLSDGTQLTSQKEEDTPLTETLKNLGVNTTDLQNVTLIATNPSGLDYWLGLLLPTLLTLLVIGFLFWLMLRQARGGVNQAFSFGRANLRLSNFAKEKVTFDDVAGLRETKEELVEVVEFLRSPQKFLDLGARIPRGVLLVGQPGTGKTLLARAVAGESNVPFFSVSASEFVEMFVGVGASRIRDAFATARRSAPSILFIDEIDAVGRQRGAGLGNGSDEREQTLNQILVELDGFDRDTHVIILAATNRPDILDPALLRPGRFDRRVILDLPDLADREAILKIHSRNKTLDSDVDLHRVAARTPGFSGADLANLMNEAAILTARRNKKVIGQSELYEAVEKVMLGPERLNRVISPKEKEITAYHEGGHALVAASLKDADPVHKLSIVSRGMAGGYTMTLPTEERHLRTRTQFLTDMAKAMGGYAAEEMVFGDISTGASNDLKEASEIARRIVTKYGMSELGPLTFGKSEELVFLGKEISSERNYSETIAAKIDEEVAHFIDKAYQTAKSILKDNKKALEKVAAVLMEKETLEQEEFYDLLKPFKIKPVVIPV